jgi:hypothetical protein
MTEIVIPAETRKHNIEDEVIEEVIKEVRVARYGDGDIFIWQEDEWRDGTFFNSTHHMTPSQARMLRDALNQVFGDV